MAKKKLSHKTIRQGHTIFQVRGGLHFSGHAEVKAFLVGSHKDNYEAKEWEPIEHYTVSYMRSRLAIMPEVFIYTFTTRRKAQRCCDRINQYWAAVGEQRRIAMKWFDYDRNNNELVVVHPWGPWAAGVYEAKHHIPESEKYTLEELGL